MARKKLRKMGGFDTVLNGAESPEQPGPGTPQTNPREINKTSQVGTKKGETRATFIMNEDQLEKIKAIAYWDRLSIKDVLSQAITDYLTKKKADLTKAVSAYKTRGKE